MISWIVDPLERLEACEKPRANIVRALDRPFDPERLGLLEEGVGRCWGAKTGISRILIATLTETFKQMNRLGPSGRKSLEDALTGMAWDAVREQIEAPSPDEYRDARRTRIKTYIERHIADADLRGHCGVSVRSLHRAFNADPAGSVSNYISRRRLAHCVASLRDPGQAHRSIIDICFSWGFNQHLAFQPPVQGAVRHYAARVQDGVRGFFAGSIDRRIVGRPGSAGASSLRQRLKLEKTPKIQIMTVAELLHRACANVWSSDLSLTGKTLGENYARYEQINALPPAGIGRRAPSDVSVCGVLQRRVQLSICTSPVETGQRVGC